MASGVRLGLIGMCDLAIEGTPPSQCGQFGIPGHRGVIGIAHRDEASGPAHPSHLPERSRRIREMLEDLMGVHHVEGIVLEG